VKPTLARTAVGEAAAQAVELTYGLGLLARSGAQLHQRSDRLARALADRGVGETTKSRCCPAT
jgi:hypothetical protein